MSFRKGTKVFDKTKKKYGKIIATEIHARLRVKWYVVQYVNDIFVRNCFKEELKRANF